MGLSAFEKRCKRVADNCGVSVYFVDDTRGADEFEDDGSLHVIRDGLRAIFDVSNGQSLDGLLQNEQTRDVMTGLRLNGKITDRVLVEEEPEEDDWEGCPECGREW